MRTTMKQFKFTFTFPRPVEGFTDEKGLCTFKCSFKSIISAEKYANKTAEIYGKHTKPVSCLIQYKTQAGLQERKIIFGEGE